MNNVAKKISNRIKQNNGTAYLVGGAVIDFINKNEPKDLDIEVFGISYENLERIFSDLNPKNVGKSFGILKISIDDQEIDLSLPRRDNKNGVGHAGFSISFDKDMTKLEAAKRRDFTINSMSLDLDTLEIFDPFNGQNDLKNGLLKVTDKEKFQEDPLRALRAMQLFARKCKSVDPDTLSLISSMFDTFNELPKERVWEEFKKLILLAPKPSMGFDFLREVGWIKHFPELEAMIGCEQKFEWHPEGDVWTHSLMAIDAAAQLRDFIPEHQREAFMLGTFLHDVGKPSTTITQKMIEDRHPYAVRIAKDNKKDLSKMLLTAYGHDVAGAEPAERFLKQLTENKSLINLTKSIVTLHMRPSYFFSGKSGSGAYAKLHRELITVGGDLNLMARVCQCDACAVGSGRSLAGGVPNWEHKISERVFDYVDKFSKEPESFKPKVLGRDLIEIGIKPGPQMGMLLKKALELQEKDDTLTKEQIITILLE